MSYSKEELRVTDFFIVPKHFFVPEIIEKRNPLPMLHSAPDGLAAIFLLIKCPNREK